MALTAAKPGMDGPALSIPGTAREEEVKHSSRYLGVAVGLAAGALLVSVPRPAGVSMKIHKAAKKAGFEVGELSVLSK